MFSYTFWSDRYVLSIHTHIVNLIRATYFRQSFLSTRDTHLSRQRETQRARDKPAKHSKVAQTRGRTAKRTFATAFRQLHSAKTLDYHRAICTLRVALLALLPSARMSLEDALPPFRCFYRVRTKHIIPHTTRECVPSGPYVCTMPNTRNHSGQPVSGVFAETSHSCVFTFPLAFSSRYARIHVCDVTEGWNKRAFSISDGSRRVEHPVVYLVLSLRFQGNWHQGKSS